MKTQIKKGKIDLFVVAQGVWGMKDAFVNIYIINNPAENNWWLVDTGFRWSGSKIKGMAELLFGGGSRPAAIILTHGHFDHVGSVKKLSAEWDIPVYAHHLEIPYLTGISAYPPTDPAAGGGILSDLSFLYPKGPINITDRVVPLPPGGRIPGLPEWRYIHTPGHAPGHISLFRNSDRVLIAGDALVTTKSESAIATIFQFKKLSGPPKYFTSDWLSAASSVQQIADLEPEIIVSGHGRPMRGETMRKSLHNLVRDFQKNSVPTTGRYTRQPALMDDSGVVHIPPKNRKASTAPTLKLLGISATILLTVLLIKTSGKKKKGSKNKVKDIPETKNNKLKYNLRNKSKSIKAKMIDKADKMKDPALKLLDKLKF